MFSRNTTKSTSSGVASLQRAEPLVEQLHRPVVDVEIELEARAEQDVARVPVVGHARIAERADEDRVELPQQCRSRLAGMVTPVCEIVIGAPGQVLEVEAPPESLPDGLEHLDRFGRHFFPDAVAGDHCDVCGHYSRHSGSNTSGAGSWAPATRPPGQETGRPQIL